MELCQLTADQLEETAELFCTCFFDDHYYARLFPDPAVRRQAMKDAFLPGLDCCLRQGDCAGIREDGALIAFVLCFDYSRLLAEDPTALALLFQGDRQARTLPYSDALHGQIVHLPGRTIYCLSVAVAPAFRRQGLASGLIDLMLRRYWDCNLVSDVSNQGSLAIYQQRRFTVQPLDDGYYFILHRASTPAHTVAIGNKVRLALPSEAMLAAHGIPAGPVVRRAVLCGYRVGEQFGVSYFVRDPAGVCFAPVEELDYASYLQFQRLINVAQYMELTAGDAVFYGLLRPYVRPPLMNEVLEDMLPARQTEWSLIPDIYVSMPMRCQDPARFTDPPAEQDPKAAALLRDLDFRTHYEAGVPSEQEGVDELSRFKSRLRRIYLGKLWVQIESEATLETYARQGDPIGAPALVDLYVTVDTGSSCAVLSWYSLSTPFLLSHLMDNIIRNQLMILPDDDAQPRNFFDYMSQRYGLVKRGTAKMFVMLPYERSCLASGQIASLLASETIYPDGESFGGIVDRELLALASSPTGIGQYDRAFVCAYTNVVLQFSPDFQASLRDRMGEASITLFFIELILLEEASIQIARREINRLCSTQHIRDPLDFLSQVNDIYNDYSRTVCLRDIRANYPTSQCSIDRLREAFRTEQQREALRQDQRYLQVVFETKCDIADRRETRQMDTSLAIISVLAIFSAWMDSHDYTATWRDLLPPMAVLIIQRMFFVLIAIAAVYVVVHLFGSSRRLRERRRLRKQREKEQK